MSNHLFLSLVFVFVCFAPPRVERKQPYEYRHEFVSFFLLSYRICIGRICITCTYVHIMQTHIPSYCWLNVLARQCFTARLHNTMMNRSISSTHTFMAIFRRNSGLPLAITALFLCCRCYVLSSQNGLIVVIFV